eukprot:2708210-Pyramimonas_sp.AAC.1
MASGASASGEAVARASWRLPRSSAGSGSGGRQPKGEGSGRPAQRAKGPGGTILTPRAEGEDDRMDEDKEDEGEE